ncbi:MAG: hypothetical protein QM820_58520 [Minicystis sp.]
MKHTRPTPLGALARGLAAGAVGSAVQDLFFRATHSIAPRTPKNVFSPPERDQIEETATQTIARRAVQYLLQRSLSPEGKARGATIVHYAFGASLGGAYGLLRESLPATRTPAGVLAYSVGAWVVGDDLVIPLFRLGAWPNAYPLKTHAYAIAAHVVFGAATAATYEALRPRSIAAAAAALWAVRANVALLRLPSSARPIARALVGSAAKVRAVQPIATIAEAARAV